MKTPLQMNEIQQLFESIQQPIVELKKISLPTVAGQPGYTSVVNRAQCVDLSQDLSVRFGIDRHQTQDIMLCPKELGPNKELVYKPVNDLMDQVRMVGVIASGNNASGQYFLIQNGSYIEISFYGTGLNILYYSSDNARDIRVTVDGGTEGSNIHSNTTNAVIDRGYSNNTILNAAKALSLGLHTVKVRSVSGSSLAFHGFEILNEYYLQTTGDTHTSTTIDGIPSTANIVVGTIITGSGIPANTTVASIVSSTSITISQATTSTLNDTILTFVGLLQIKGSSYVGGNKRTLSSNIAMPYNSDFESGTLGTKGGRVLVYQKEDGTVKKALTPTEAGTPTYLTNALHTNEEIIREYNWREFGCGRGDDFSYLTSTSAQRIFTLDDNNATMVGANVLYNNTYIPDALMTNNDADYIILNFTGTGIDVDMGDNNVSRKFRLYVDGVDQGVSPTGLTSLKRLSLVSGLPYGTHTIKIKSDLAGNGTHGIRQFLVYGPKKPTLPEGAIELGEYYITADFSQNITAGIEKISTGVIRHHNTREHIYSGAWAFDSIAVGTYIGGWSIFSSTATNYAQMSFYGTGFDARFYTTGSTITVQVDGANYTGAGTVYTGAGSWSQPTLTLSGTVLGGFIVTGLPLGWHTVKFIIASGQVNVSAFDAITPTHCPKNNCPHVVQNTLPIGNCNIGDLRKFSSLGQFNTKIVAYGQGIAANPSTTTTTASPVRDLELTIYCDRDKLVDIDSLLSGYADGNVLYTTIFVDGVQIVQPGVTQENGITFPIINHKTILLAKGYHHIKTMWYMNTGTGSGIYTNRQLFVKEV